MLLTSINQLELVKIILKLNTEFYIKFVYFYKSNLSINNLIKLGDS